MASCGGVRAARRLSGFNRRFDLECPQVIGEGGAEIRALQGKFHCGFQEAELVSGIVPFALKVIAIDFLACAEQPAKAVSQLQLTTRTEEAVFERLKDCGRKNVMNNNLQVGRCS